MKNPDAIIMSDPHLREDTPLCRTDNYIEAQTRKLKFLSDLQTKYTCPILNGGDLFDWWKASPWLLRYALKHIPDNVMITIPGQHDLPNHSMLLYEKSGMSVLEQAGHITVLHDKNAFEHFKSHFTIFGVPYGMEPMKSIVGRIRNEHNVLILHQLCWHKEKPFPDSPAEGNAISILKKYPDMDLIITGDHHRSFAVGYRGRLLINPGSMMRMTADQIDFEPSCFLWYAEDNTFERVPYPIRKGVVSREHIEKTELRDNRLEAFIEGLRSNVELGLSFEDNVNKYIAENKLPERTIEILKEVINAKKN